MTTKTNRLASGKWARLSLGAVAATALTAASVTPAMANDHRDRDGISAGEVIAGARVEVAPYKRAAFDFVLWKPSTDDLPGWDSPSA